MDLRYATVKRVEQLGQRQETLECNKVVVLILPIFMSLYKYRLFNETYYFDS